MISNITIQRAKCDKCGFEWNLHKVVPKKCGKCQTVKWNEDSSPIESPIKSVEIKPKLPLKVPMNSAMEKFLVNASTLPTVLHEEKWEFSKKPAEYNDDGNVYRVQFLSPEFKKGRTVRVDEFNHEEIIKIVK